MGVEAKVTDGCEAGAESHRKNTAAETHFVREIYIAFPRLLTSSDYHTIASDFLKPVFGQIHPTVADSVVDVNSAAGAPVHPYRETRRHSFGQVESIAW